ASIRLAQAIIVIKKFTSNLEPLFGRLLRDKLAPNLIGYRDVDLVLEDNCACRESTSAWYLGEHFSALKLVVKAKLSRMMLKDIQDFLASPNNLSSMGLEEKVCSFLSDAVG